MSKQLKTILLGLILFLAIAAGVFIVNTVQKPVSSPTPSRAPVSSPTAEVPQVFVVDGACSLSFSVEAELVPGLNCVTKDLYADVAANTPGTYNLSATNLLADDYDLEPGEQYVYVISYENTGTGAGSGTITDVLPAGLTYVDSSQECDYTAANRTVTCEVEAVAAGGEGRVAIRFEVDEDISADSVSNVAILTPTGDEESASTCRLSNAIKTPPPSDKPSQTPSATPSPSPVLEAKLDCIAKRAYMDNTSNSSGNYYLNTEITNTNTISDGQTVVFNVAIKNLGGAEVPNATITDVLSSNLTFVDADTGCSYNAESRTVTCQVGNLAAYTETSRSFRAKVGVASTTAIANTADVTSTNGQRDSCSITINAAGEVIPPSEVPSPAPVALPEAGIFEITAGTLGLGLLLLIVGAIGLILL